VTVGAPALSHPENLTTKKTAMARCTSGRFFCVWFGCCWSKNALRFCSIGAADLHKSSLTTGLFGTAKLRFFRAWRLFKNSVKFPKAGFQKQA